MAYKALITPDTNVPNVTQTLLPFNVAILDTTSNAIVSAYGDGLYFGTDITLYTPIEIQTVIQNKVITTNTGTYTLTPADFLWEFPQPFTPAEVSSIKSLVGKTYNYPTRSLNTAFQISSTLSADVSYSVEIATSVSLAGGAVGTVILEYADNSGMTSNVKEVARTVNGNTGTLVVGLTLNQTTCINLAGAIPAGKYVRLRTANTTGTPTFTLRSQQEVY